MSLNNRLIVLIAFSCSCHMTTFILLLYLVTAPSSKVWNPCLSALWEMKTPYKRCRDYCYNLALLSLCKTAITESNMHLYYHSYGPRWARYRGDFQQWINLITTHNYLFLFQLRRSIIKVQTSNFVNLCLIVIKKSFYNTILSIISPGNLFIW